MSKRLSDSDLTSRRRLDFAVVQKMTNDRFAFTAHRTPDDAVAGKNPIRQEKDARHAVHYRAEYQVPTLIGPDQYSPRTIVRIDVSHAEYPFEEPTGWVVESATSKMPWSPHFLSGTPICNGSIWRPDGQVLLGHYLIHVACLLNWDEELAPDYGGWNPKAVAWWRNNLDRPLDPTLVYPSLPQHELYGQVNRSQEGGFRPSSPKNQGCFRPIQLSVPSGRFRSI